MKIKTDNSDKVKLLTDLTEEELNKYNNIKDKSIILHHKEFKGLNILELFDCKDTSMTLNDYKHLELPALLQNSYNDIYNSFVKAMYADGYKIKYCDNLDSKFIYDKETKTVNIQNGLSNRIKIHYLVDVFSNEISSNNFEKELFKHAINKGIGIEDEFDNNYSLIDWYKNTDFKDVEKTLKLLTSKCRRFVDNFNKFFDIEKQNYIYVDVPLYNDCNLTI